MLISVAYSASLGGTSTIIGTGILIFSLLLTKKGPNLVFKAQMQVLFPNAPEITFFQWSLFAWPLAFLIIFIVWLGFCRFLIRNSDHIHFNMDEFQDQYRSLGPISFAEGFYDFSRK
jgi:sodium-dependent dicarboxylate transporter 2/3/5